MCVLKPVPQHYVLGGERLCGKGDFLKTLSAWLMLLAGMCGPGRTLGCSGWGAGMWELVKQRLHSSQDWGPSILGRRSRATANARVRTGRGAGEMVPR